MKLFIDDIRKAPDDSWIVARTVKAAIRCIARFKEDIAEISLDHDISHQIIMGGVERPYPCPETFQSVAHFIGVVYGASAVGIPKIHIHSSNPVGADSLINILDDYGIRATATLGRAANRLELEV